ncbi:42192_t:CDS:1, partial [Gigaspora margarita]
EDLPLLCLFSTLVKTYKYKKLSKCKTKERPRIQNADTNAIKTQIKLFEPYFVELSSYQNKLEKYTICE